MNITTISREFGSGGREFGKRLANELGIAYYDKEIVSEIAKQTQMDKNYVENTLNHNFTVSFPYTFRNSFHYTQATGMELNNLLIEQHNVLKKIAEKGEDCVIVGRDADITLSEYSPFKIFIYAEKEYKIERCKERATEKEQLSHKEIERKMKEIDKARASHHNIISHYKWGNKEGYHLCINTSGIEIKSIIPIITEYIKNWFLLRK